MSAKRSTSRTWSVYDGLWEDSERSTSVPYVTSAPEPMTLRGCGLCRGELLSRGAQGAIYSATDPSLSAHTADEEGVAAASAPPVSGRLVAVKRLFVQASDFGARGVAETVLREATLLGYVGERQAAAEKELVSEEIGTNGDIHGVTKAILDGGVRVVALHRIVEAPHGELCLELEHCPLDLSRLAIDSRRRRRGEHTLGVVTAACTPQMVSRQSAGVADGCATATAAATAANVDGSDSSDSTKLPLCVVRYLLRRLLVIVRFLHERCHVLHRDLKLSNVLVTRDGDLRLSDFGSSRLMTSAAAANSEHAIVGSSSGSTNANMNIPAGASTGPRNRRGGAYTPAALRTTRLYQAPECLLGADDYGPPMEVWSIGVMFAELLRQTHLFSGDSELAVLGAIWKLLGPPPPREGTSTSGGAGVGAAAPPTPYPAFELSVENGRGRAAEGGIPQATLPLKFNSTVVPPEGLDLLQRMLTIPPQDRITIADALAHPFLATVTPEGDAEARQRWVSFVKDAIEAAAKTVSVKMSSLQLHLGVDDDEEPDAGFRVRFGGVGFGSGGADRFGCEAMDMALRMGVLDGGPTRIPGLGLGMGLGSDDDSDSDSDISMKPPMFTLHP